MRLSEQHYIGFTKSWYRRGVYKHHFVTIVFDNSSKTLSFMCEYKGERIYSSSENHEIYKSQGDCVEAAMKYIDKRLVEITE